MAREYWDPRGAIDLGTSWWESGSGHAEVRDSYELRADGNSLILRITHESMNHWKIDNTKTTEHVIDPEKLTKLISSYEVLKSIKPKADKE